MSYTLALALDLAAVTIYMGLLFSFGKVRHSHPGMAYLVFHLFTVTARLVSLANGSPTLFSPPAWNGVYEPVRPEEIARAAFWADVTLISMATAWVWVANSRRPAQTTAIGTPINEKIVWLVVIFTLPFGLWGLVSYSALPGMEGGAALDLGSWSSSSYLSIMQTWVGLALLAGIYVKGFKPWLILPMAGYLAIIGLQGYHRFRLIIPAILLFQIYLDRKNRRWPGVAGISLLCVLALLFFPLKTIGKLVRNDAPLSEILDASTTILEDSFQGRSGDQQFLDQFASSMQLVDDGEKFYWGHPYYAMLALPIPRQLWSSKPSVGDYIRDFSRPWRPMGESGMIVTFIGESYANFGYFGVLVFPFLAAWLLGKAYLHSIRAPFLSIQRFVYLMIASNLIQVFRDGFVSLYIFTLVNMMPLLFIVVLHLFMTRKGVTTLRAPQRP